VSASKAARVSQRLRDQQREETHARLFDAALTEFQRLGFASAQIDDIVSAAGVARGTFYFHFPSKDHVLIELQRTRQTSVVERIEALRGKSISVNRYLHEVIDVLLEELVSFSKTGLLRDLFAIIVSHSIDIDWSDQPVLVSLTHYFAEAQERAEVRNDLGPSQLTVIFLTSIFGILLATGQSAPPDLRATMRRATDVFVRGISP
jgi:AcrR family transcriptional regulator